MEELERLSEEKNAKDSPSATENVGKEGKDYLGEMPPYPKELEVKSVS